VTALSILFRILTVYWLLRIAVTRARILKAEFAVDPSSHTGARAALKVSVCVPARDEADVIGGCVRSILAQEWPDFELILVDDGSSDGTGKLAEEAASGDSRLRVIQGAGPPPGWMGKAAACHRAASEATGDWLLFVDADVTLHPRALSVAMGAAQERGSDMLSWIGGLQTVSFGERLVLPYIADLLLISAPFAQVNDPVDDHTLANGQFILISRRAYDLVGGHEAIRESVVDDVSLARAVKFHRLTGPDAPKLRFTLLHAFDLMEVRMYTSLREVWSGFAKNMFAASKRSVMVMGIGMTYVLISSVLPFVLAPLLLGVGHPVGFDALAAVVAILAFRSYTRRFQPVPWPYLLLHPVAAALTVGIMLDSTLRGLGLRAPVQWKGRPVR
jgi:glycosyltransferase involved in cell wall biosynthesis